ncbi:MAG: molybdopterin-dependent oxidoreductase [Bacillota bacterium]|nr:molybdopterin-dependent oxidoreductase [Bacillota bacterium]
MNMTRSSFCPLCDCKCPVLLHLEGHNVVKVSRLDFLSKGSLCFKGKNLPELLNSSRRLQHPLKRVGERGSNTWQEISWKEGLEILREKLFDLRLKYGSETLIWDQGYGSIPPYLLRFLNLFGTPNLLSRSHICSQPRKNAQLITFGALASPDVENSKVVIVWGKNKLSTAKGTSYKLLSARKRGARFIVVDPRQTSLARMAQVWLPLRPGTDGALALGFLHVIIRDGLYDQNFIQQCCVGFEELREQVSVFTPAETARITGLPEKDIISAARIYAIEKPASIEMGNGLDQHTNSFQSIRAILSLMAVSGNLNVKGGNTLLSPSPLGDISRSESLPEVKRQQQIGKNEYPLLCRFKHTAAAPTFIQRLHESHRESPRALVVTKGNPFVTLAQAEMVQKALTKLDFITVSDFILTETAKWADLVFPAAFASEGLELLLYDPALNDNYYADMPKGLLLNRPLPKFRNTKTDTELVFALANEMGLQKEFWMGCVEESFNERLQPLGLTLKDFGEEGLLTLSNSTRSSGVLKTPTTKVELFSAILQKEGLSPLPCYSEPQESPLSSPELLSSYPLIFSSFKSTYYVNSSFRWSDSLREKEIEPMAEIHPETAAWLGLADGQSIEISSLRGSCRMCVRITAAVPPGTVFGVHGWEGRANINFLTSNEQRDPVISSNPLKSLLCSVKGL